MPNSFPQYPTTTGWWATTAAANTTVIQPYAIDVTQFGHLPASSPQPVQEQKRDPTPREWLDAQIEETCALAGIAA